VASKIGCQYGYGMLWLLAAASLLMIAMTALSARLGVATDQTFCSEIASRLGRPWAALIGTLMFLVVASFQSSNNMAVVASVNSLVNVMGFAAHDTTDGSSMVENADIATEGESDGGAKVWAVGSLLVFNGLIIGLMFGLRRLYEPLEWFMKILLLVMLVGFTINLILAGISISDLVRGLIPHRAMVDLAEGIWPKLGSDGKIADPLWAIQGMIATTFSVGAAFYQGYLVKEKGWTLDNLGAGFADSVFGIGVLGICSGMIMITSAAAFHGKIEPHELKSAADVGAQLEPLFGRAATVLFACGLFAACFSSFLVNAMIGGVLLADGFGLGGRIDSPWCRRFTGLALVIGMAIGIQATIAGKSPVGVIVFAQALTVLGVPLIALSLLYLATCRDVRQRVTIPAWMYGVSAVGFLVTVVLATRTAWKLYLQFS